MKVKRASDDARDALARLRELEAQRQAAGLCRHCGGTVPCMSSFGDAKVGVRWSQLSKAEARRIERGL